MDADSLHGGGAEGAQFAANRAKAIELSCRMASATKRGVTLLNLMKPEWEGLIADPSDLDAINLKPQRDHARYVLEENLRSVIAIVDLVRSAMIDFASASSLSGESEQAQRDAQEQIQRSENAFMGEWLRVGKPIEEYLRRLNMEEKAAKEEAAKAMARPNLTVPPFDGNVREYYPFRDEFMAMQGRGERSGSESMLLLRKALAPNIARNLDNLGHDMQAYDEAWRRLDKRYGDRRQIRQLLSDQIRSVQHLSKEDELPKLRRQYEGMVDLWGKLIKVWPERWEYEKEIYPYVARAFPLTLIEKMEDRMPEDNDDVQVFLDQIAVHLRKADRRLAIVSGANGYSGPKYTDMSDFRPRSTKERLAIGSWEGPAARVPGQAVADVTGRGDITGGKGGCNNGGEYGKSGGATEESPEKRSRPEVNCTKKACCELCDKGHWIAQCPDFCKLSVPQKEAKIRFLGLCLRCFSGTHYSRECTSSHTCKAKQGDQVCGGKHHTLLHRDPDE